MQQFAGQRRALLGELAGKAHAERIALEPVIGAAVRHVSGLREFAEDRLTGPAAAARGVDCGQMLAPRRHANGMVGIHLDSLAARRRQTLGSATFWATRPFWTALPRAMMELDQALDMFAPMRMAHIAAPQLRWSYYFSAQGDFLTMFPFAPSTDFVALGGYREHAPS